jgi:hypothetical protein
LLFENEPCFLVFDAFAAYKKKTDEEKKDENDFVTELKKLNCTISMVLAGGTEYV